MQGLQLRGRSGVILSGEGVDSQVGEGAGVGGLRGYAPAYEVNELQASIVVATEVARGDSR